jgi:hypothetical protein
MTRVAFSACLLAMAACASGDQPEQPQQAEPLAATCYADGNYRISYELASGNCGPISDEPFDPEASSSDADVATSCFPLERDADMQACTILARDQCMTTSDSGASCEIFKTTNIAWDRTTAAGSEDRSMTCSDGSTCNGSYAISIESDR